MEAIVRFLIRYRNSRADHNGNRYFVFYNPDYADADVYPVPGSLSNKPPICTNPQAIFQILRRRLSGNADARNKEWGCL